MCQCWDFLSDGIMVGGVDSDFDNCNVALERYFLCCNCCPIATTQLLVDRVVWLHIEGEGWGYVGSNGWLVFD
jgi:hypothetical protein